MAEWLELETVDSTQDEAARLLRAGASPLPPVILAKAQTKGRGRFGREWFSPPGDSLSLSLILSEAKGHPQPWLLGMALACAAAGVIHGRVRWPNDVFLDGKKVGGILPELIEGVPVLGIGLNLNQMEFPPEIAATATSLALHRPGLYEAKAVAQKILARFFAAPLPQDWPALAPVWALFDDTAGKHFRLPTGEEAIAVGLGPHGELLCSVDGESRTVMAADAILGVP
ncbi:MAG TPA: biotin--[acetyl-CoA-carboxylase] ligase [Fimbriimonadaceae bacterium]|nr:biotin--[acetyl-CoA-carboxylase] ligase [Fimbriimonadaceae bacterium]